MYKNQSEQGIRKPYGKMQMDVVCKQKQNNILYLVQDVSIIVGKSYMGVGGKFERY